MRQATKRSERLIRQKAVAGMTKADLLAEISRVDRTFKTGAAYREQLKYGEQLRAQFSVQGR
jgi:hypothetical protein